MKNMALYQKNSLVPIEPLECKSMKKKYKCLLQNAKRTSNDFRIYNAGNRPKEIWKIIKESKFPKSVTPNLKLLDSQGNLLDDSSDIAIAYSDSRPRREL
jgi:hypothetical protein